MAAGRAAVRSPPSAAPTYPPVGLADGLRNSGVLVADPRVRAPHILSLRFPAGMPDGLIERLAAENVFVSPRLGLMRISPHVYNGEADGDRFVATFRRQAALT